MVTKFKVLGVKEAQQSILKRVNKAISDSKLYEKAHLLLEEEIRSGTNPKTGRNYKKLAPATVEHRRYLAKHNDTHERYSASGSNLTLSGRLLEGLFSRFNKTTGVLTIDIKGKHPGYKGKKGQIKGSAKSRKKIVDALEDQKRFVLKVSDSFIQRIVKSIEKKLKTL
jgi:hypothetical protein